MRYFLILLLTLASLAPASCWAMDPDVAHMGELIKKLKDPDAAVRGRSIVKLRRIGPEARDAIPALIAALSDKDGFTDEDLGVPRDVRNAAYLALYEIGLEAAPALTAAVSSESPDIHHFLIECLGRFGPRARPSLDTIIKVLDRPDRINHLNALIALSQIDRDGSVAMPILERIISRNEFESVLPIQADAAELLQQYPRHAKTVPILLTALKSPNAELRGAAVLTLINTPQRSEQIVKGLLPLLHDYGSRTQFCKFPGCFSTDHRTILHLAAQALVVQQASGALVIPELMKELKEPDPKDPDPTRRLPILRVIPEFQTIPPGTATRIFEIYERAVAKRQEKTREDGFNQYDLNTELYAIGCLAKMGTQGRELLPKWEQLLKSNDSFQPSEAAIVLATLSPDKHQAQLEQVEAIIDLSAQFYDDIPPHLARLRERMFPRGWADLLPQIAFQSILSNPKLAEEFLPRWKEWSEAGVFRWSDPELLATIERLGPKAQAIARDFIDDTDTAAGKKAFLALGPGVVPSLIADAESTLPGYQIIPGQTRWGQPTAIELLPEFGEAADAAWHVLLKYSESPHPAYRVAGIEALGKIAKLRDKALPEILRCLKDKRCIVRAAAATSLGNVVGRNDTVIPALITASRDSFADVRAAAVESLIKLGVQQAEVRAAIQQAAQDSHPYIKLLASEALQPK